MMSQEINESVKVRNNKFSEVIRDLFKNKIGTIIALILLIGFFAFLPATRTVFLSTGNVFNIIRQASTNLYMAIGMTMVIILGGIDLSVGSIVALSGVVTGGMIAYNDLPVWVAVIAGLVVGLLFGAFNGLIVSTTTIPSFIVTLATMNIARGFAYIYTGGAPIRVVSSEFNFIGSGYVNIVPTPVIYLVILAIISIYLMTKTKLGRYIYAVGGNSEAARFSGISNAKVTMFVFTFSGLMAAISGVVLASRMFSGQPTAGSGAEMDAIAAVVVGGTSMQGGIGTIGGTIIGGMIIAVLNNGLNLMNVSSFWQYVVKGAVILVAVYIDYFRNKNKEG